MTGPRDHHRPYAGQPVALLTQHGKEAVIAPALEPPLGCRVQHVSGFDTDTLGTFTGDIPRAGSQLDAARRKARQGMALAGLPLGIASEGSFGPDPYTGLFEWDTEILVWIDDTRQLEVVGMAQGPARSGHLLTDDGLALQTFAAQQGFPAHHLVVRADGADGPLIAKGIAGGPALQVAFEAAQRAARTLSASGKPQVWAELDLRAFANPTRMQLIAQAARDLAQRLSTACPACALPGFGVTERLPGLPCAACRRPTTAWRAEVWCCPRCAHRNEVARTAPAAALPRDCPHCNP